MTNILVAEDDKFLAKAYKMKLSKKGYTVQNAGNGEEAIKILESFTPDVIILDLLMPVMDGFATLGKIKSNPKWKQIPVIVATNLAQADDVVKAMRLGASDYIVKTDFSTRDLIAKIEGYLEKNKKPQTESTPQADEPPVSDGTQGSPQE